MARGLQGQPRDLLPAYTNKKQAGNRKGKVRVHPTVCTWSSWYIFSVSTWVSITTILIIELVIIAATEMIEIIPMVFIFPDLVQMLN